MRVHLEQIGGGCPTQAWGTIGGYSFYFRARHGTWTLDVGPEKATDPRFVDSETAVWSAWGNDPTEGWMAPEHAAWLVGLCLSAYTDIAEGRTPTVFRNPPDLCYAGPYGGPFAFAEDA